MEHWELGLLATLSMAVFADYIRMKIILTRIEWQLGRLSADRESEKDTLRRLHSDFDQRIRSLEIKTNK